MTITFPRSLPASTAMRYMQSNFELVHATTEQDRDRAGGVWANEWGDPYWSLKVRSPMLKQSYHYELRAWWYSMRGGMKTFLAYDPAKTFPSFYASEATVLALTRASVGGTFDGTFEITSFPGASGYLISTINPAVLRLPANFKLKVGDYIGIEQSGKYSLHMIMEDSSINSAGNSSAHLIVEPAVPMTLFSAGAIARVVKAVAEFVPIKGSLETDVQVEAAPASFEAMSVCM